MRRQATTVLLQISRHARQLWFRQFQSVRKFAWNVRRARDSGISKAATASGDKSDSLTYVLWT